MSDTTLLPDDIHLDDSIPVAERVDDYDPALENLRSTNAVRSIIKTAPGIVVSVLVHLAIVLTLGAVYLPQVLDFQHQIESSVAELEDIQDMDEIFQDDPPEDLPLDQINDVVDMDMSLDATEVEFDTSAAQLQVETAAVGDPTIFAAYLAKPGVADGDLGGRGSRGAAQATAGMNEYSERAVAGGLGWFANHQLPDGSWSYNHNLAPDCKGKCRNAATKQGPTAARMSATAMAILPYLGAGITHKETTKEGAKFKNNVKDALNFIKNNAIVRPEGVCLYEKGTSHQMYHQGVATIAVCEAAAMSRDKELERLAQGAIRYLCWAQHEQGGWRYAPKQAGDTSGFGWAFMALKSGQMAYLHIPPTTVKRAKSFLDNVTGFEGGSKYGYLTNNTKDHGEIRATTSIGLLCQMYMGWRADNAALQRGADFLAQNGPDANNLYYSYYATQVLHHLGGERWDTWNKKLRDALVKTQATEGHEKGSWAQGPWMEEGGRLHTTSFATMILEVYYRHMPIYRKSSATSEFPLD